MHAIRVYADTSVFGGTEDVEFAEASRAFFRQVHRSRFVLLVSQIVLDELQPAPPAVRHVLENLSPQHI